MDKGFNQNADIYQPIDDEEIFMPVMFMVKNEHRSVIFVNSLIFICPAALFPVMQEFRLRHVKDLPARILYAITKIDIFP